MSQNKEESVGTELETGSGPIGFEVKTKPVEVVDVQANIGEAVRTPLPKESV